MFNMQANLDLFPPRLMVNISEIINGNFDEYDQILIIYYNKYKTSEDFSFEHLCRILTKYSNVSIMRIINSHRINNDWNLKSVNLRIINYVSEKILFS